MEARDRQLKTWFERIRTGQTRLPRFQRFEAWNHQQIASLLETVVRDLPVGATLVLEIGDSEPFVSRSMAGAPKPTERVTEHLLDGQQRLTALWRALHDDYADRTYLVELEDERANGNDDLEVSPRVLSQARWDKDGQRFPLWVDRPSELRRRGYVPAALLNPDLPAAQVSDWCDRATEGDIEASRILERKINTLRDRVRGYNIPLLFLPVRTPKHVALDVFINLNTRATRLSAFDIIVAQVEEHTGASLHKLVNDLREYVPALDRYVEPEGLILDVAALREGRPPTQASYQQMDLGRLVEEWEQIRNGIQWAIEILEEEKIYDGERLPTIVVVPVLGALAEDVPSSLDGLGNARALVRKYLWRAFLTRRYENSAATRAQQDLRGLRNHLSGREPEARVPIFDAQEYPLPSEEELKRAGWPKAKDLLGRGVLAVALRSGAHDLADGAPASVAQLRKREYHHLFPDALLRNEAGLDRSESHRALNCALITWQTNRSIAAKEPLQYLKDRVNRSTLGEQEIRARLLSQLVPYDELAVGGYEAITDPGERRRRIVEDYERFLVTRARMLQRPIGALCSGQNP